MSGGPGGRMHNNAVTTVSIVGRLIRENFSRYAHLYAVAFGLMSLFAGCTAASAWLMKDVVNHIFVDKNQTAMIVLPLIICAIFVAKGFAAYFQEIVLATVGNRIVAETQTRLFAHVLRMDAGFFQRQSSAELVTSMTQRVGAIRDVMNITALGVGRDLFTLVSLVGVMIAQDPAMTLVAGVAAPMVAIGLRKLTRRIKKAADSGYHSVTTVVATTRDTVQGIKVVKSFQLEGVLAERMKEAAKAVERINNKLTRIQSLTNPLIESIGGFAVAAVVAYAGWTTIARGQTPGEFFAFITALLMAADPLRRLSRMQLQLSSASMGVRSIYEILDTPPEDLPDRGRQLESVRGAVEFDKVSFSYPNGAPVLQGLSFIAEGGKTTAIVGLSGAGKSTILQLIQKIWHPAAGNLLIDGQRLDEISTASLRSKISVVGQDVFLFEGTIRDNIAAGCPDRSEDDIRAAARAAHIDAFIESLPSGYDTSVGELGSLLSGGQRQRISIARAFLKDAPIILLDEPTSALDSRSEHHIHAALSQLTRGRTAIVVAHRFSTVVRADRILVLADGGIAECGGHEELVAAGGIYAGLYSAQGPEFSRQSLSWRKDAAVRRTNGTEADSHDASL
jgi:ATP-binding cassette, subfamily B, bacterial MsbA